MDDPGKSWRRRLAFVPVAAVGVIVLVALRASRAEPQKVDRTETGRRVRALTAEPMQVVPRATGYGVVQAREEWQMVAEVSGRVVELAPQLEEGNFVEAGTTLIKIDPGDYELSEARQAANLEGVQAQIAELRVQEANTRESLKIEERSLELAEASLERLRTLRASGAVSAAEVDAEERNVLAQRKAVQAQRNTLRQLPASRKVLEAQIKQQEAGLEGAARDVARTEIVAPYDVRIRDVRTSLQEVVGGGQVLAVADGIDMAEIPAQFTIGELRPLVPFSPTQTPLSTRSLSRLPELVGLSATVRLESSDLHAQWSASFDRFTSVDPQTRTVGVVVTIADPYRAGRTERKPPVVPGMYMEVELQGRAREACLAVPRSALHGDVLYVVDQDSRLARRTVELELRQPEYACIAKGLSAGEQVVLTDLVPAIEGMLLDPVTDEEAGTKLAAAAAPSEAAAAPSEAPSAPSEVPSAPSEVPSAPSETPSTPPPPDEAGATPPAAVDGNEGAGAGEQP
ncbi:efflux RND transporter periplasmic adaptor subunit [Paraliomyxa miuraensis]|uniref:efflux RND transporter periplasmic adaptor subunit n=1 Tax=Paraliomyxa miuraensis TaxID=376150 RepID=UPI0022542F2E|nr:hypothetical protein [Paraliomyxa miuraensis]MCX4244238.1 hypothetical protein [Paraliomyxa miuraensis]